MIVILPTSMGYLVGSVALPTEKAKRKALAGKAHALPHLKLADHLATIKKWMRLSKRYSN